MSLAVADITTPFKTDEDGVVRIGTSRVALERIVHAFDAGASAEEIVESYPSLELGDVYAAIAYVLKHRSEVDAYMTKSEADSEQSLRMWEGCRPTADLRKRIRERASSL